MLNYLHYMRIRSKVISAIIFAATLFILAGEVNAQTPPDFPACSNPQGTLKVSYNSGTHGIAGDTQVYSGSDTVYSVDEFRTLQCFCSVDGEGTQTNWWKISSLTQDEIDTLKNLGWVYVPSGEPWGLSNDPYMAKNSEYACGGGSSSGSVAAASTGGSVLAATGTSLQVLVSFLGGLMLLLSGWILKRKAY